MAASTLRELVKLTIYDVVDNETDGLSSPCRCCEAGFENQVASYTDAIAIVVEQDHGTKAELQRMCVAAHGLSLLLIAEYINEDEERQEEQLLFDTGPVPSVFRQNAQNLRLDLSKINTVVLSHYHMDHYGGFDAAIPDILVVDLSTPVILERGIKNPVNGNIIKLLPDTPTVDKIQNEWNAHVELHSEAHVTGRDCFYVSGFIPRRTSFETGLPNHYSKFDNSNDKFVLDPDIRDERYVAVKLKGRGYVVFSACSHAGIVNVCRDVMDKNDLLRTDDETMNLVAVVGGFHLAGRNTEDRTRSTIEGLKELDPDLILAGHCTGWKAKAQFTASFEDNFQVLSVGG